VSAQVPVCGCIVLSTDHQYALMVQSWQGKNWYENSPALRVE
jgi:hypothetical protein